MRLHSPQDVPRIVAGIVCRHSRWGAVFAAIAFTAIAAAMIWLWFVIDSVFFGTLLLLIPLVIAPFAIGDAINSFRATNWVAQIAPDGLWLNLRSFRHVNFSPARTALFVRYDEIAGVGEYFLKWVEMNQQRQTIWKEQYLDVELKAAMPAEVGEEINAERLRKAERAYLGGLIKFRSSRAHVPVIAASDHVLRIAWRTSSDIVSPRLKTALAELARYVPVRAPVRVDRSDVKNLSQAEMDDLILSRVQSGDQLSAMQLLQQHRNYTGNEAREFVERLISAK